MPRHKSLIILSEKSSGSSALQHLLASIGDVRHVLKTRHCENETLYWTKAASVLGMPQRDMVDSEVPISCDNARADLITMLGENLDGYVPPSDDRALIMDGWARLCRQHAPVFLEKSPHHLCQQSALALILQAMQELRDVDFLLVGLVRNPMDTLYSQYQRWKSRPDRVQQQWLVAYRNLLQLKETVGERLVIVRYEDMIGSLAALQPVLDFCDCDAAGLAPDFFHGRSVSRWKNDPLFGFMPSDELVDLAASYGYGREQLRNEPNPLWPLVREFSRARHKAVAPFKQIARQALRQA